MNRRMLHTFIISPALLLAACATDRHGDVNQALDQRLGHRIQPGLSDSVAKLVERELSSETAVEIALVNNPGLKARFEDLGIAEADLVQAGLMRNPVFAASWRFPDAGPRIMNAEYSVTAEFLDLLMIPLRKQIAQADLQRVTAYITHDVLQLAADVKTAFFTAQAQEQIVQHWATIVEVEDAAATLAGAQHDAGTMTERALVARQLTHAEARRHLADARMELISARENLTRLLGLWGADVAWRAGPIPPALPETEWPLQSLESLALSQRLDYAAARTSLESLAKALGISEDFRYLASVKIGVNTEHETSGTNLTGPTLELEIPIFDNGTARIAAMRARYEQSKHEFTRLAVNIRSETREARDRLLARRELAEVHAKDLVPLRRKFVELTLLHANVMVVGPYDLLDARREEATAQLEAAEALRDYWIARTELERAVGGRLGVTPTAPQPATAPAAPPAHDHSSHGGTP
jgi:outer membrane protein, heavy metal efflux system